MKLTPSSFLRGVRLLDLAKYSSLRWWAQRERKSNHWISGVGEQAEGFERSRTPYPDSTTETDSADSIKAIIMMVCGRGTEEQGIGEARYFNDLVFSMSFSFGHGELPNVRDCG